MLKLEDLPNELNAIIDSYNDKRIEHYYTFHWFLCSQHRQPCWYTVIYADCPCFERGERYSGCTESGLVVRYAEA